jgi:hypothetical protein
MVVDRGNIQIGSCPKGNTGTGAYVTTSMIHPATTIAALTGVQLKDH